MKKGRSCYAPALVRYVALTFRRDTTVRRDDGGLVNARQNAIIRVGIQGSNCRWIESLDDEPDAKRQLPSELRDYRDGRPHGDLLVEAEQRRGRRGEGHGAADQSQHGQVPWNESGAIHQVA